MAHRDLRFRASTERVAISEDVLMNAVAASALAPPPSCWFWAGPGANRTPTRVTVGGVLGAAVGIAAGCFLFGAR